jgi:hypothetical protein
VRACIVVLGLLALGVPAVAQEGPAEGEKFDIEKAMREIDRLLGEAEDRLLESARGEPSAEAAGEAAREASKKIEELLRGGREKGDRIVDGINHILDNLPRGSGGGGGQQQPQPDKQDGQKRDQQESQDLRDRDPRNSREGDPRNGEKEPDPQSAKENAKPPPDEAKEKAEVDPSREWLPRLPDKVREARVNGNFEEIPEKYRSLIEAWTKKLSDLDDDD